MKRQSNQQGSALILALIMMIMIMSMVLGVFTLSLNFGESQEQQVVYDEAMHTSEMALSHVLRDIQAFGVQYDSNNELQGFVEMGQEGTLSSDGTTRTVTRTFDGITYTVRVCSAYQLWQTYGSVSGYSLYRQIDKSTRENLEDNTFDIYELTAAARPSGEAGFGKHEYVRGLQLIVELKKITPQTAIPTPLYIDEDYEVSIGGNISISGRDHVLQDPSGIAGGYDNESDWFYDDPNDEVNKMAIGYALDWSNITWNGGNAEDQTYTREYEMADDDTVAVDENGDPIVTELSGESAYVQTKQDLRALAKSFVGDFDNNALRTDTNSYDLLNKTYKQAGSDTPIGVNNLKESDFEDFVNTTGWDDTEGDFGFDITYVKADANGLGLAGLLKGSGVLVIDGDVNLTGQLEWHGVVIVLGEVSVSGGGAGTHINGSLMTNDLKLMNGTADVWWNQAAIDRVLSMQQLVDIKVKVAQEVWRGFNKEQLAEKGL